MPVLLKLFHKIEREGPFPNSFYETAVTLIPKPHKDSTKKVNYKPISPINIDVEIFSKIFVNRIQELAKKIIHHDQVSFTQDIQE